jgi:decaprenylphospho-beta-D-erythro-pentofuranosid-2-ulose 2-reductase
MRDAVGSVQSVLVLGATSDIAAATTRALVARRARRVLLAARRPEDARPLADELLVRGADTAEMIAFDARDDAAEHERVAQEAFDRLGDVDVALVAFGVLGAEAGTSSAPEAVAEVLETNFAGAASIILAVARRMVDQGHGTIVVLSSVAGERVRRSNFVYGASKAGLDGFAQGLGDALAGTGVDVMVVRPGFVQTRMTAGRRPPPLSTTPDAVATAIVQGLARRADIIWVPAALRVVMSALRHLPRRWWRRLPL